MTSREPLFESLRNRLRDWLLPFAGEHAYRNVADLPFRFSRWLAYRLWRIV